MKRKGVIDVQTAMSGVMLILIVGIIISIGVPTNDQLRGSMVQLSSSTSTDSAIENVSENVDEAYELGSNIPLIGIAVVIIIVLVGITKYF